MVLSIEALDQWCVMYKQMLRPNIVRKAILKEFRNAEGDQPPQEKGAQDRKIEIIGETQLTHSTIMG